MAAANEIDVASIAAIQEVVIEAALQQIDIGTALQGIASPTAIEQVGSATPLQHIITTIPQQLIAFAIANQHLASIRANGEATGIEKVVHPRRHVAEALIAIAIFVDECIAFDLKADVKHTIGNSVDQIAAEELGAAAIVLDLMETGFAAIAFVITMIFHELVVAVGANPAVDEA